MKLRVVFRADASIHIGQGHVMRCLALAEQLRQKGAICRFVSAGLPGNLTGTIRSKGFVVEEITPFDQSDWMHDAMASAAALGNDHIDWLVVDHYGLDHQWEGILKGRVARLLVIDDLANRRHDCDFLLDQNPGRLEQDYRSLVDPRCKLLLGPAYALLREEFSKQRTLGKSARDHQIKKLLISLGGTDANNVTAQVISVLESTLVDSITEIKVILSAQAPCLEAVREQARRSSLPIALTVNPELMSELLSDADLAIGAAGVSALERCRVGLPSLLIITAANQRPGALALHALGAAHCLGNLDEFENSLREFFQQELPTEYLEAMSARAREIVDGQGCARIESLMSQTAAKPHKRVSITLDTASTSLGRLRPIVSDDLRLILSWRNHPDIRRHMRNSAVLDWSEHLQWFERKTAAGEPPLLFEIEGIPIGFVQFNATDSSDTVEWGFYVAPDSPKGTGRHLGVAAISHIFHSKKIDHIVGHVMPDNLRSQKFHESLGFQRISPPPHHESSSAILLVSFSLSRSEWLAIDAGRHGEPYECHF
jgi:UDP-2,4-diacetamido-2,4,6-trideoxy-beta-L-altropyranose hydrolase